MQGSTAVILLNFCAKFPPHRQAEKRWAQPYFQMHRGFLLLVIFSLKLTLGFGQIHDTARSKTINLPNEKIIKPKHRIILYESDTFIIYSSFQIIVSSIKDFYIKYQVTEDSILLDKFFNTSKSLERNLDEIKSDNVLKERLGFRIMDLLQKKKCLVYNKDSKLFEKEIVVTNYVKNWWTGIRFSNLTSNIVFDIRTGAF